MSANGFEHLPQRPPASVRVILSADEVEKLLTLCGHDGNTAEEIDCVNLVKSLYRARAAFECSSSPGALPVELTDSQLYLVHRSFTPQAFGQGGREFQLKLALAFVELERAQDVPGIAHVETVPGQEFGIAERLGLVQWSELEGN